MKRRNFILTVSAASASLIAAPAFGQTLRLFEDAKRRISLAYARSRLTPETDPERLGWINVIADDGGIIFDESEDFIYKMQ